MRRCVTRLGCGSVHVIPQLEVPLRAADVRVDEAAACRRTRSVGGSLVRSAARRRIGSCPTTCSDLLERSSETAGALQRENITCVCEQRAVRGSPERRRDRRQGGGCSGCSTSKAHPWLLESGGLEEVVV